MNIFVFWDDRSDSFCRKQACGFHDKKRSSRRLLVGDSRRKSSSDPMTKVIGGKIVEEIGLDDGVTALTQLGLIKAATPGIDE